MRGKPNWDWVPCLNYAGEVEINTLADPPTGILLVAPRSESFDTPLSVGIPDTADQLTVHRIVGQLEVIGDDSNPVRVCARISTVLIDNAGLFSAFAENLFSPLDANEPFLWQRYFRLAAGENTLNSTRDPMWSHIDVRVKRTIGPQQALAMLVHVFGTPGVEATCRPYLRTLVKVK